MYAVFEKLCKERGITPYRVSKETGIATATLSDWKNGKSKPKADKIKTLAAYFHVTPEYFETGDEKSQHHDYYTDPVTAKMAEDMATNPELRALYDVQRNMDPEDLQALYNMALALKRKAERTDMDDPC